jgi:hypothetical protein
VRLAELDDVTPRETDPRLSENERLISETRRERIQHEGRIREASRRISSGLGVIRRATLRVIPD